MNYFLFCIAFLFTCFVFAYAAYDEAISWPMAFALMVVVSVVFGFLNSKD